VRLVQPREGATPTTLPAVPSPHSPHTRYPSWLDRIRNLYTCRRHSGRRQLPHPGQPRARDRELPLAHRRLASILLGRRPHGRPQLTTPARACWDRGYPHGLALTTRGAGKLVVQLSGNWKQAGGRRDRRRVRKRANSTRERAQDPSAAGTSKGQPAGALRCRWGGSTWDAWFSRFVALSHSRRDFTAPGRHGPSAGSKMPEVFRARPAVGLFAERVGLGDGLATSSDSNEGRRMEHPVSSSSFAVST